MTQTKSISKTRFLPLIFGLLILSGCLDGGGSGSGEASGPCDALPEDPGEAGMQTLLGIDSNDNGLRDDVEKGVCERQQELAAQSTQTDSIMTRQALEQLAKNIQNDIALYARLSTTTPAAVTLTEMQKSDIFQSGERAVRCLLSLGLDVEQEVLQVRSMILNTTARYTAYREIDAALAGTFYEYNYSGDMSETSCEE